MSASAATSSRLDQLVYGGVERTPISVKPGANPVETQIGLLKAAFGGRDR